MLERLTSKERRIVHSVARGLTNREVADELALSKTVEWALTRVYRKVGVRSRRELVLLLVGAEPSAKNLGALPDEDERRRGGSPDEEPRNRPRP